MNINAYDRCASCHCEFADHNYIPDSIDQYKCPHPHVETGYGSFPGGDPRKFSPDWECTTPQEQAAHAKACELWDELERQGQVPEPEKCPSGWIYDDDGKQVCHVLRVPYGLGVYSVELEQYWESMDTADDCTHGDLDDGLII